MQSLAKVERWDAEYVDTQMRVAHHLLWSTHRYPIAQVAFRAVVAPIVVEVHQCLCASSRSVDSLWGN
jgi:hypothetical protein